MTKVVDGNTCYLITEACEMAEISRGHSSAKVEYYREIKVRELT